LFVGLVASAFAADPSVPKPPRGAYVLKKSPTLSAAPAQNIPDRPYIDAYLMKTSDGFQLNATAVAKFLVRGFGLKFEDGDWHYMDAKFFPGRLPAGVILKEKRIGEVLSLDAYFLLKGHHKVEIGVSPFVKLDPLWSDVFEFDTPRMDIEAGAYPIGEEDVEVVFYLTFDDGISPEKVEILIDGIPSSPGSVELFDGTGFWEVSTKFYQENLAGRELKTTVRAGKEEITKVVFYPPIYYCDEYCKGAPSKTK
jgi:hypothetical protein